MYSNDNGDSFTTLWQTPDNILLSLGYTGAQMGVYATSNGKKTNAYADFDWIRYKGIIKE